MCSSSSSNSREKNADEKSITQYNRIYDNGMMQKEKIYYSNRHLRSDAVFSVLYTKSFSSVFGCDAIVWKFSVENCKYGMDNLLYQRFKMNFNCYKEWQTIWRHRRTMKRKKTYRQALCELNICRILATLFCSWYYLWILLLFIIFMFCRKTHSQKSFENNKRKYCYSCVFI